MRLSNAALGLVCVLAGGVSARADHQPNIVVPGRADVPVIINGIDASWGVAESDWGLYRPGAVPVTVIPPLYAPPRFYAPARHYFPSLGGKPYVGRIEREPPAGRTLPRPAQSYRRSWSAESPPVPATEYAPSPQIMVSPEINFPDSRHRNRHRNP